MTDSAVFFFFCYCCFCWYMYLRRSHGQAKRGVEPPHMENRTEQNSIGQKSSFSICFGSLLRIRAPILPVRVQDFAMWHERGDPRDMPRRVLTPTHAGEAQLNLIDEYAMLTRMQPFGPLLGSDTQLMVSAGLSEHGSAAPTLILSPRVQHAIHPGYGHVSTGQ